jgi:pilus assembly protein Flp/PilA
MSKLISSVKNFIREEEGAQVVEYALIIALVSIVLALALSNSTTGLGSAFQALITRVSNCFTNATCAATP